MHNQGINHKFLGNLTYTHHRLEQSQKKGMMGLMFQKLFSKTTTRIDAVISKNLAFEKYPQRFNL